MHTLYRTNPARFVARLAVLALALSVFLGAAAALAVPMTARSSGGAGGYPDNAVPMGKSPTTGLDYTGTYQPLLVQISNAPEARPHWNLSEADIVYEAVYWGPYHTRYTAVYSDNKPDLVGSIRSARTYNLSIRTEWDAPLVFWGGQDAEGTSIYTAFSQEGISQNSGFRIDGTTSKYTDELTRAPSSYGRSNPHDAVANLAALMAKYPEDHTPKSHAFQFSDTAPAGGDTAVAVDIQYGADYHPSYTYNETLGVYERSYNGQAQVDGITGKRIVAANVIVQRAVLSYFNNTASRPVYTLTGSGEADLFIGGKHIQGSWMRNAASDRTVFLDSMGVEVPLMPGKTFIQIVANTLDYTYTRADGAVVVRSTDPSKLSDVETMVPIDENQDEIDNMG